MQQVKTSAELKAKLAVAQLRDQTIGFVPTMGNLHKGHLKLVDEARKQNDFVVVSIFVNPTQFGPDENFATYPRTIQNDIELLKKQSVNLVFIPEINEIYLPNAKTTIELAGLTDIHCGAYRPGHFNGVATVVCKLLNLVQPDQLYLGKKDYQQWVIIKQMVQDLNMNCSITGVTTVREQDGLAMSSRNSYLSEQERMQAPKLYQALEYAKQLILNRLVSFEDIEKEQINYLLENDFKPEYFSICDCHTLEPAKNNDRNLIVLTATRLGKTRLIDNIEIDI